ncbi:hypothetical protein P175DRAFT_0426466 [Aspergillus ochraceoroseus IBT 24754]|uniref:DUF7707 domain-containing protein n=3 Tax=Aspergillus subgen. Nidulantes TaxID=2720870 RepID=A0A0F8UCU5_9EURO|nr:uncharacterized protein P175DRAFT_0426466 [Aspergillus ochraceoroseus IBT 24754]KKK13952.1 hypothetical protein AOCH_002954 [Aspergillus ochraceoroseus]KKK17413.1 hypothetical protein ARAM_004791 [Aspergillus rambellii]PTU23879.1 hypothetical protein P175DRAFT_0426466 [Aspergillus ochraceoroseus IBT 24754]
MVLLRPLIAIASMVGVVHSSSDYSYNVNISAIAQSTRDQWCQDQKSSCPLLCFQVQNATGQPTSNTCDDTTLSYSCVCSNGLSPNSSEYSQTIPYYLCTEANSECVAACSDSTCQYNCRADNPCGAQSPTRVNATSSTAATATQSQTTTTTLAPFTGVPEEGRAAQLSTDLAQVYGLTVVVGGFLAGFAALL